MSKLLDTIDSPAELRALQENQLIQVAQELREFIIDIVSTKEGHLGASLGVVELTIALHYVFNTPDDQLVWDVGHQAYGHKLLTERKSRFHTNRQLDGISGFPKRAESIYDAFGVGHSSTAISAALGMALASIINKNFDKQHIAVVGDASIASGMAFEGLNHAGVTDANLLVILNDNAIGIDPSVGALKQYLTQVKNGNNPRQNNMIKSLNFDYTGPIDGHDLPKLISELKRLKDIKGPKFLHIITTKGKGLKQAEANQVLYHAPGKFDKVTGEILPKDEQNLPPKFQDVFGLTLVELANQNDKIVGITPAMPTGSSMKYLMESHPERAFDVGIAEQHAVTLAAGMATQGLQVFCNIYSTFMQRAYDQIIHDVALQNLPVIFCLDRAGLVGEDGATHQGVFDISYLNCIPNMILYAPLDEFELRDIMYTAQLGMEHPIAIRYPRGRGRNVNWQKPFEKLDITKAKTLFSGGSIAVISTGVIGNDIQDIILEDSEIAQKISHYHFSTIKPLDANLLDYIAENSDYVVTIEEGSIIGGFGSHISTYYNMKGKNVKMNHFGIPDVFIEHGNVKEQSKQCGIDVNTLKKVFKSF